MTPLALSGRGVKSSTAPRRDNARVHWCDRSGPAAVSCHAAGVPLWYVSLVKANGRGGLQAPEKRLGREIRVAGVVTNANWPVSIRGSVTNPVDGEGNAAASSASFSWVVASRCCFRRMLASFRYSVHEGPSWLAMSGAPCASIRVA